MEIGNLLNNIVMVEESYNKSSFDSVAHTLVKIYIRGGLYESMDFVFSDVVYTQTLDYINVPSIVLIITNIDTLLGNVSSFL
jgi:hypothetical protein